MATYPAESFYRGTIRQSIANNTSVPFTLKVSKIPTLTSGLLTVSPNTANEEIIEYSGVDGTALTITVTKRGISPSAQALTVNGTDYNNATYQKAHSQNDTIRGDVNHLHIIQDYGNLQSQINNKVDTAGGLRTTMGASRQTLEIDATGAEIKKSIIDGTTISTTETIRKRKVDGTYEEVPYSFVKGDIGIEYPQYVSAESLAQGDAVYIEYFGGICSGYLGLSVGNTTGTTRFYQQIFGSGVSMSSLTTPVIKSGTPLDNYIITIETDDGTGKPSGTLAHANATCTRASSGFSSAGWVDEVWTFSGAFTLTLGTRYHIVIKRSGGVDAANFISFEKKSRNTRMIGTGWYTGASYASPTYIDILSCSGTGILKEFIAKASASLIETSNCIGFAKQAYSSGELAIVSNVSTTSGLTDGKYYYLSNTPGAISLTSGTIKCVVGYSKGSTTLIYEKNIYNPYSQDSVLLQFMTFSLTNSVSARDFIFKDYGKLQLNVSGSGPRMIIRVDGVILIDTASSYTMQFEPNKIYTITFAGGQGPAGTATFNLSRTYPFNHANLIY